MTEYRHLHSGKVRDLYEAPDGLLLMVASDRISAYDFVLPTPIPDKGRDPHRSCRCGGSSSSPTWCRTTCVAPTSRPSTPGGRCCCRRLEMCPVECVARGYLAGSGLAEYRATGAVCGVPLPPGLVEGSGCPSRSSPRPRRRRSGEHDENVTYDDVVATVGADARSALRDLTLAVYRRGRASIAATAGHPARRHQARVRPRRRRRARAGRRGADPGLVAVLAGRPVAARAGAQPSYDKQFVRDWLTSPASGWDRASGEEPPPLPDDVVERDPGEVRRGLRAADRPHLR